VGPHDHHRPRLCRLGVGIPIGILLALGRQSERIPVIRSFCVVFIELVRSVPFIVVLIMGSIMLPMFLPSGWDVDLLLRARVAVIMSAAANSVGIVRGGMASVGKGQFEAARAIGLGYWRMMVAELGQQVAALAAVAAVRFAELGHAKVLIDQLAHAAFEQLDQSLAGGTAIVLARFDAFGRHRLHHRERSG
jgi:ABC-type methionine transport system permease subunit